MSEAAIKLAQKWQQTDWNTESPVSADFAVSEAHDVINALIDALREAPAEQPARLHEMTPEMMRKVQMHSELGAYAAANLAGAYDLFSEFWRVAMSAAPQPAQPQQELGVCGERRGACGIPCEPCEGKPDPDYVPQPAQPQQEPVAWMQDSIELYVQDRPSEYYTIPLYTSPPASKPWVGLTDKEIEDAWPFVWRKHESVRHFAIYHAIEAKLKEKNT